jgi:putative FmdB family regulatory protein
MPTYDYHCTACGHQWEQVQSIKADPEHSCPKCHKHKAKRGVGMGAAILVGGKGSAESANQAAKEAATPASTDAAKKPAPSGAPATPAVAAGATKPGAAGSSSTPAAPTAKPADSTEPEHKSSATHPAREGRGVGNMNDALARARRQQEQKLAARNVPRGGGGKGFSAPKRPPPSRSGGKKG